MTSGDHRPSYKLGHFHKDVPGQIENALRLCHLCRDRICEVPLLLWPLRNPYGVGDELSLDAELVQDVILVFLFLQFLLITVGERRLIGLKI